MLGSAISYADDVNIFLNNRVDSEANPDTKPQMLFLMDIIADDQENCSEPLCYIDGDDIPDPCPDSSNNNGSSGDCVSSLAMNSGAGMLVRGDVHPGNGTGQVMFQGEVCTYDADAAAGTPAYVKKQTCRSGDSIDPRPIIEEIMRQRPDAKIGVMALNKSKSANLILPVEARSAADMETDIATKLMANTDAIMLDGSSIPTAGGLDAVYKYLRGDTADPSPLTADCENMQLVILTNGGWKDDAAPSTTSLQNVPEANGSTTVQFLTNAATFLKSTTSNGCNANILTSVIGLGVDTDDAENAPLFLRDFSTGSTTAKAVADAGGGIYLNTDDGGTIVNELLAMLDYSYPTPSALVSPTAPVSINRSHTLDLLLATAFKPEGKVAWPGNMTTGTIAQWTGSADVDPTEFTNTELPSLSDITIKTDLCAQDATGLCDLSATNSDILSADDVSWLKGSGVDKNDLFGDPIHFKPLAIHYGDLDDSDGLSAGDLYILVGTNRGLLHMFKYTDSGLAHQWAFFPKSLERMIPALRNGNQAPAYSMVNHFYGVDGAPSAFIYDANRDGKIENSDNNDDRALVYFGLRRGGSTYYAFDVTTPTSPELQWSRGESIADYGTKPDAEIDIIPGEEIEIVDPVPAAPGGGDCPYIVLHSNEDARSTGGFGGCTGSGSSGNCLNYQYHTLYNNDGTPHAYPSYLVSEERPSYLSSYGGEIYSGGAIYLEAVVDREDGVPIWTHKNQCVPDLSEVNTHVFEAHMLGTGNLGKGLSGCAGIALKDQYGYRGQMAIGAPSIATSESYGNSYIQVGFDLTALPSNAVITSAKLTLAYSGESGNPDDIYNSGVAIFAAKDGIYGSSPLRETSSCGDWNDNDHYSYIGYISKGDSVSWGERTSDGDIYPSSLYADELYQDEKYISALTQLFNTRFNGGSLNDTNHDIGWVQFKIKPLNLANPDGTFVSYGFPENGPFVANWNYNNQYTGGAVRGEDGFVDYWDKMVPKLELTWRYEAPNATASESDMSILESEFNTRRGGSNATYSIEVTVDGTGTISGGGSNTCSNNSICTFNYTSADPVTLSVSSGTLSGWSGECSGTGTCQLTPGASGSIPEVTATFEAAACTPGNGTGQLVVASLDPVKGKVSIDGAASVDSYSSSTLCPGSLTIEAKPESGYKFEKWGSDLASCTEASCTVTISEGSNKTGNVTFVAEGSVTETFTVTVSSDGNGAVTVSPPGSDCDPVATGCSVHDDGTSVTVSATATDGFIYKWTGCSGTGKGGSSGSCSVTADADVSITFAKCTEKTYSLGYPNPPGDHVVICGIKACAAGDGAEIGTNYYFGNVDVHIHSANGLGYSNETACKNAE